MAFITNQQKEGATTLKKRLTELTSKADRLDMLVGFLLLLGRQGDGRGVPRQAGDGAARPCRHGGGLASGRTRRTYSFLTCILVQRAISTPMSWECRNGPVIRQEKESYIENKIMRRLHYTILRGTRKCTGRGAVDMTQENMVQFAGSERL